MVSCQKGPTRHAYVRQIGPFWQDTLDIFKHKVLTELLCFNKGLFRRFEPTDARWKVSSSLQWDGSPSVKGHAFSYANDDLSYE